MAFGWTQRVREAWQWVKSGVQRALDREPAFDQYTAGGGEIEPSAWEAAWEKGEEVFFKGGLIKDLPQEAIILPDYFTVVDIDYAGKYHLSAEVGYFNKATGAWETKHVSANMDEAATRDDWEMAMVRALRDTEESPDIDWEKGITFWNYLAEERS